MKTITLVLAVVLLAPCATAKEGPQPFPRDEAGRAAFQGVVPVEGASASELYSRAKFWAAKEFSSVKNVIQLDDPASGRLVLKGSMQESFGGLAEGVWFHFTLTVEVKDGRYRWTLDQLEYWGPGQSGEPIERELTKGGIGVFGRKAVFERFRKDLLALAERLQTAMTTVPDGNAKVDKW